MRSIIFVASCALLLAVSVPLAPPAFCAEPDWILLDENRESSFFYDRSGTTSPREDVVQARTRVVYTELGRKEALKVLGVMPEPEKLYESRYMYEIDCTEREGRLLAVTHLDKEGRILKSADLGSLAPSEYLPPGSRLAVVASQACSQ